MVYFGLTIASVWERRRGAMRKGPLDRSSGPVHGRKSGHQANGLVVVDLDVDGAGVDAVQRRRVDVD